MDASSPAPPGFFGKVPARGDFLSRRLPPGLAEGWEDWLGILTTAAREAAGPGWPDAWLTAPLWHFSLGSALAPPHGAAGVLVASADRVGRLFPFTVVGACDPGQPPDDAALGHWMHAVEEFVLDALQDGWDPATLDAQLAGLGPPPPVTGSDEPPGVLRYPAIEGPEVRRPEADAAPGMDGEEDGTPDAVSVILDDPPEHHATDQKENGGLDPGLASILGDDPGSEAERSDGGAGTVAQLGPSLDRPGPGQSVWWCRGSDRVAPVRLRCDGLPTPATGAAMVLGGAEVLPA